MRRLLAAWLCLALIWPAPASAAASYRAVSAKGAGPAVSLPGLGAAALPPAAIPSSEAPSAPIASLPAAPRAAGFPITPESLAPAIRFHEQLASDAAKLPPGQARAQAGELFHGRPAAFNGPDTTGSGNSITPAGLTPGNKVPGVKPTTEGPAAPQPPKAPKRKLRLWHKIVIATVLTLGAAGGAWYFIAPRLDPVRPPETIVDERRGYELGLDKQALYKAAPDPKQPALAASLSGPKEPLSDARVSDDGKNAVTVTAAGSWRIWSLEQGQALKPGRYPGRAAGAYFTDGGRTVVFIDRDATVSMVDLTTLKVRSISQRGAQVARHSFSPDGRRVAFTSGSRIVIVDLSTARTTAYEISGEVLAMASTDQGTLLATTMAGKIKVWQIKTGQDPEPLMEKVIAGATLAAAEISPNGQRIIAAGSFGGNHGLVALTVGSSKMKLVSAEELELGAHSIVSIASDKSGEKAAVLLSDGRLFVWDIAYEDVALLGRISGPGVVRFSPDGARIVTTDPQGGAQIWVTPE